jgi:hypothetical protein
MVAMLHCISVLLVDETALMIATHTDLRGVGLYADIPGPLVSSEWIVSALALFDYLIPVVIYLGIFLIFSSLSRGVVFEPETLRGVRFLSWSTLLVPLQQVIFNTLASLTSSGFEIVGELVVVVTYEQFLFLFVGLCLVVLARVFSHAVELARENEGFV